ncbi:MAG: class SAM-dependent methyltransferase [Microbacteriaceae bacterium]|jgi:SAM-dependent methyltransferase|nr:class SAM-dependent methyltransferase [Microbacteriaceae bacterium]
MTKLSTSKSFWNTAARENAAWYIATGFTSESEEFFASGDREVDVFLARAGLSLSPTDTVVEIGSGAGRMTRRLAALAGSVVATDVSGEMLSRARANLTGFPGVTFIELSGDGDLPLDSESVDAVFSYITMQHVPTAEAQARYFAEAIRVVKPGGWVYVQFRRSGLVPRLLDWAGHLAHRVRGRRTFDRAWRGSRVSVGTLRRLGTEHGQVTFLRSDRRHIWALATRE